MADTSITRVQAGSSPHGQMGQKYLAAGVQTGLRLWDKEPPGQEKSFSSRDYETVGYVIEGRAQLETEGQRLLLEQGDSWAIPKGARHRYVILEEFTAVEATSPPAFLHGRDETASHCAASAGRPGAGTQVDETSNIERPTSNEAHSAAPV